MTDAPAVRIALPAPAVDGGRPLFAVLAGRRSGRDFAPAALRLDELSQLLWAAQGVTGPRGERAAPSAGATFPMEIAVVAERVEGLKPGRYRYRPRSHDLAADGTPGAMNTLATLCAEQDWIAEAALILVLVVVEARTATRYGHRAHRYVRLETGHAAQNILLTASALGLAATAIGAFVDGQLSEWAGLDPREAPLYVLAVGRPR